MVGSYQNQHKAMRVAFAIRLFPTLMMSFGCSNNSIHQPVNFNTNMGQESFAKVARLQCPSRSAASQPNAENIDLQCNVKQNSERPGDYLLEMNLLNYGKKGWQFLDPDSTLDVAIWLLKEGEEVPLTRYGEVHDRRVKMPDISEPWLFSGKSQQLLPNSFFSMSITLSRLFQIEQGCNYTVVVEIPLYRLLAHERTITYSVTKFSATGINKGDANH